ncbi:MAG TPA: gephyrin-like molybdotransferase Glp [Acidimicrobiia bacterium]|nr:gephyrin-like molybdotransferase Glp [Acidimicrobiia bacterium]
MRTIEDVRGQILGSVRRKGVESVSLDEAVGRVLAAPVVATHDVPSFSNSAMDGFAVRSVDVASPDAVLEIVDDVAAGQVALVEVGEGQAVKIMTGAPMPSGADTVVRVEDTEEDDGKVRIVTAVEAGTSVRPPGGDVKGGTMVFGPGVRITEAHVGTLATIGVVSPLVARRPRVAVMSTGDELVPATTETLEPGMIRDSNRPMILGLVADAGAEAVDFGRIPDDADSLRAALGEAAATTDAIVTSGGVSMGEYDVTKMVLREEADVDFYPVAMKPGKPQGFGKVGGKPFFGLPGNPVSVFVSFEQFVRPALLHMQGATSLLRPRVMGVAGQTFESDPAKEEFIRVRFESDSPNLRCAPSGGQGSHVLSGVANADAFVVMEVGVDRVDVEDPVIVEMFRSLETRSVDVGT